MQVDHLFSYPLYNELWNHKLINEGGYVTADTNDLKKYKAFLEELVVSREVEKFKAGKIAVDKVQELLKHRSLTSRQSQDLSLLLDSLGLQFSENGYVIAKPEVSPSVKKYLGAREPCLSRAEREFREDNERFKVLKCDLKVLDEWLDRICSSTHPVRKPEYSLTINWKDIEKKSRERTRKRLNQMEKNRKIKVNNFHSDNDYKWKRAVGMKVPKKKRFQKAMRPKGVFSAVPLHSHEKDTDGISSKICQVSDDKIKKEKTETSALKTPDKTIVKPGKVSKKLPKSAKTEIKQKFLITSLGTQKRRDLSPREKEVLRTEKGRRLLDLFRTVLDMRAGKELEGQKKIDSGKLGELKHSHSSPKTDDKQIVAFPTTSKQLPPDKSLVSDSGDDDKCTVRKAKIKQPIPFSSTKERVRKSAHQRTGISKPLPTDRKIVKDKKMEISCLEKKISELLRENIDLLSGEKNIVDILAVECIKEMSPEDFAKTVDKFKDYETFSEKRESSKPVWEIEGSDRNSDDANETVIELGYKRHVTTEKISQTSIEVAEVIEGRETTKVADDKQAPGESLGEDPKSIVDEETSLKNLREYQKGKNGTDEKIGKTSVSKQKISETAHHERGFKFAESVSSTEVVKYENGEMYSNKDPMPRKLSKTDSKQITKLAKDIESKETTEDQRVPEKIPCRYHKSAEFISMRNRKRLQIGEICSDEKWDETRPVKQALSDTVFKIRGRTYVREITEHRHDRHLADDEKASPTDFRALKKGRKLEKETFDIKSDLEEELPDTATEIIEANPDEEVDRKHDDDLESEYPVDDMKFADSKNTSSKQIKDFQNGEIYSKDKILKETKANKKISVQYVPEKCSVRDIQSTEITRTSVEEVYIIKDGETNIILKFDEVSSVRKRPSKTTVTLKESLEDPKGSEMYYDDYIPEQENDKDLKSIELRSTFIKDVDTIKEGETDFIDEGSSVAKRPSKSGRRTKKSGKDQNISGKYDDDYAPEKYSTRDLKSAEFRRTSINDVDTVKEGETDFIHKFNEGSATNISSKSGLRMKKSVKDHKIPGKRDIKSAEFRRNSIKDVDAIKDCKTDFIKKFDEGSSAAKIPSKSGPRIKASAKDQNILHMYDDDYSTKKHSMRDISRELKKESSVTKIRSETAPISKESVKDRKTSGKYDYEHVPEKDSEQSIKSEEFKRTSVKDFDSVKGGEIDFIKFDEGSSIKKKISETSLRMIETVKDLKLSGKYDDDCAAEKYNEQDTSGEFKKESSVTKRPSKKTSKRIKESVKDKKTSGKFDDYYFPEIYSKRDIKSAEFICTSKNDVDKIKGSETDFNHKFNEGSSLTKIPSKSDLRMKVKDQKISGKYNDDYVPEKYSKQHLKSAEFRLTSIKDADTVKEGERDFIHKFDEVKSVTRRPYKSDLRMKQSMKDQNISQKYDDDYTPERYSEPDNKSEEFKRTSVKDVDTVKDCKTNFIEKFDEGSSVTKRSSKSGLRLKTSGKDQNILHKYDFYVPEKYSKRDISRASRKGSSVTKKLSETAPRRKESMKDLKISGMYDDEHIPDKDSERGIMYEEFKRTSVKDADTVKDNETDLIAMFDEGSSLIKQHSETGPKMKESVKDRKISGMYDEYIPEKYSERNLEMEKFEYAPLNVDKFQIDGQDPNKRLDEEVSVTQELSKADMQRKKVDDITKAQARHHDAYEHQKSKITEIESKAVQDERKYTYGSLYKTSASKHELPETVIMSPAVRNLSSTTMSDMQYDVDKQTEDFIKRDKKYISHKKLKKDAILSSGIHAKVIGVVKKYSELSRDFNEVPTKPKTSKESDDIYDLEKLAETKYESAETKDPAEAQDERKYTYGSLYKASASRHELPETVIMSPAVRNLTSTTMRDMKYVVHKQTEEDLNNREMKDIYLKKLKKDEIFSSGIQSEVIGVVKKYSELYTDFKEVPVKPETSKGSDGQYDRGKYAETEYKSAETKDPAEEQDGRKNSYGSLYKTSASKHELPETVIMSSPAARNLTSTTISDMQYDVDKQTEENFIKRDKKDISLKKLKKDEIFCTKIHAEVIGVVKKYSELPTDFNEVPTKPEMSKLSDGQYDREKNSETEYESAEIKDPAEEQDKRKYIYGSLYKTSASKHELPQPVIMSPAVRNVTSTTMIENQYVVDKQTEKDLVKRELRDIPLKNLEKDAIFSRGIDAEVIGVVKKYSKLSTDFKEVPVKPETSKLSDGQYDREKYTETEYDSAETEDPSEEQDERKYIYGSLYKTSASKHELPETVIMSSPAVRNLTSTTISHMKYVTDKQTEEDLVKRELRDIPLKKLEKDAIFSRGIDAEVIGVVKKYSELSTDFKEVPAKPETSKLSDGQYDREKYTETEYDSAETEDPSEEQDERKYIYGSLYKTSASKHELSKTVIMSSAVRNLTSTTMSHMHYVVDKKTEEDLVKRDLRNISLKKLKKDAILSSGIHAEVIGVVKKYSELPTDFKEVPTKIETSKLSDGQYDRGKYAETEYKYGKTKDTEKVDLEDGKIFQKEKAVGRNIKRDSNEILAGVAKANKTSERELHDFYSKDMRYIKEDLESRTDHEKLDGTSFESEFEIQESRPKIEKDELDEDQFETDMGQSFSNVKIENAQKEKDISVTEEYRDQISDSAESIGSIKYDVVNRHYMKEAKEYKFRVKDRPALITSKTISDSDEFIKPCDIRTSCGATNAVKHAPQTEPFSFKITDEWRVQSNVQHISEHSIKDAYDAAEPGKSNFEIKEGKREEICAQVIEDKLEPVKRKFTLLSSLYEQVDGGKSIDKIDTKSIEEFLQEFDTLEEKLKNAEEKLMLGAGKDEKVTSERVKSKPGGNVKQNVKYSETFKISKENQKLKTTARKSSEILGELTPNASGTSSEHLLQEETDAHFTKKDQLKCKGPNLVPSKVKKTGIEDVLLERARIIKANKGLILNNSLYLKLANQKTKKR